MSIRQRLTLAANALRGTQQNSMGSNPAQDFLRYGPQRTTLPDFSQLIMSEKDKYTDFMYGALTRRANKVVTLAKYNIKTKANDATADAAKQGKKPLVHPYLQIIDESLDFANNEFWREIQSYVDLRGEYFLMAIRGKIGEAIGEVKQFKLLSPYDITIVRDGAQEVIGYVEARDGIHREIPPHMIIHMHGFNPFSRRDPFSMADAATGAQFTLKETSEHMRTAMRRNRKYPGVAFLGGNDVALDPEQVQNFKSRMRGKGRDDEPMFATGSAGGKGGIMWSDMQLDLRKSSVDLVNEASINGLSAVTGMSKTKLGIEQSGVTRDTADVQEGLFIGDHAIPALEFIIDQLNQDYKRNSPKEYKQYGYMLEVESPLEDDKDADIKELEIRTSSFDLYTTLINKGYDEDTAAAFASGEKDLSEIGKPVNPPVLPVVPPADGQPTGTPPATEPPAPATPPKKKPKVSAKNALAINQISARDIPGLYDGTGIDPEDLGCIMVNVDPLDIVSLVEDGEADLVNDTNRHQHQVGAVAEVEPHITLLYGLLENGNVWKDKVDAVLDGWSMKTATIEKVDYFDTPDSYAVVARIKETPALIDGHERLTLLPHIQTFSEYKPHMTLAYVKKDADITKWVKALGIAYNGKNIKVTGINYGDPEDGTSDNSSIHRQDHVPAVIRNQLDANAQTVATQQQGSLKNAVINVQHQVVTAVLNKVTKNQFEQESDIIDSAERTAAERELELALATFYTVIIPLNAASNMNRRMSEFGLTAVFGMDREVTSYIKLTATRAAGSHMDTILGDILDTVRTTEERLVQDELKKITPQPGQSSEEVLQLARKKALEGVGREQIAAAIRQEYSDTISKVRATTIARTETNRAFNRSQYEADRQFLAQNDLTHRAYKKWITRSGNPCPFCKAKAAEPPIPFDQAFAKVGDVLKETFVKEDGTTSVRQMQVGFEDCVAGEVHPNGQCTYQLIIE